MGKKIWMLCLLLVLGIPLTSDVVLLASPTNSTPIRVIVNGQVLPLDVPPIIREGRTLVPLRAIFEALGAAVGWQEATQTITGQRSGQTIVLRVGNTKARVGDAEVTLVVPPVVINGRTMVPVRFIAEGLGAVVVWDEATRTVKVTAATGSISVVTMAAQVVGITDGDTMRVRLNDGSTETVRLIGVDTPESTSRVEPFGREAAAFATKQLEGERVFLETDAAERDRFRRLLAYVWISKPQNRTEAEVRAKMFNARLLLEGYANVMTVPPNVQYAEMFLRLEREAREASRGLWERGLASGITIASVDLVEEVVVIRNNGTAPVDISNWTLVSEVGNQRFVFPRGTVIQAGASLAIVSGQKATAGGGRLVWTRTYIWNNERDPAILLNANGVEVVRR